MLCMVGPVTVMPPKLAIYADFTEPKHYTETRIIIFSVRCSDLTRKLHIVEKAADVKVGVLCV